MYNTQTFLGKRFTNYELFQIDIEDNLPEIISKSNNSEINILVVGAWRGDEIQSFLSWPKANIWAFEPNPTNFNYLYKRYKNNKRVHTNNFACGEKNGTAELHEANLTGNDSLLEIRENNNRITLKKTHTVEVKTLDSLKELENKDVDLIWIDVQGYELPVLLGGEKVLSKTKALFLELNKDDRTYLQATTQTKLEIFLNEKGFYNAHQEIDEDGGSGVALYLNKTIKNDFFIEDKEELHTKRINDSLKKRTKLIVVSNNFLYRTLAKILPTSIKVAVKKIIKI